MVGLALGAESGLRLGNVCKGFPHSGFRRSFIHHEVSNNWTTRVSQVTVARSATHIELHSYGAPGGHHQDSPLCLCMTPVLTCNLTCRAIIDNANKIVMWLLIQTKVGLDETDGRVCW